MRPTVLMSSDGSILVPGLSKIWHNRGIMWNLNASERLFKKRKIMKIAANHKSTTNHDKSLFLFSYFRQRSLVCCFAKQTARTKRAARQFLHNPLIATGSY